MTTKSADTVKYNYQTVNVQSGDCHNDTNICSKITVQFPVFPDQKQLNRQIKNKISEIFPYQNKSDTSISQLVHTFINGNDISNSKCKLIKVIISDKIFVKVLEQGSSICPIEINISTRFINEPDSHETNGTIYINWNTLNEISISLNDILIANYQSELNKIGEKEFRIANSLSSTAPFPPQYYFEHNQFFLPDNFLITEKGIRFTFQPGQIGRINENTTVFIPYQSIKHLLRPNTVISQYIK